MKFIHTADLHLSSDMESRLSPEKARIRRRELLDTFARLADLAVEKQVTAVILAGDVFDEGKPRYSDKKSFIDVVRDHPSVDFLCLSGNHDESLAGEDGLPENLLCFGETWTKYSYEGVDVWGVEQTDANYSLLYSTLKTDAQRTNIVCLHGQTLSSASKPEKNTVVLPYLRGKGIDYLALGHVHAYKEGVLDERGVWCYSGCLEGRGYDECGEKGFVFLEVDRQEIRRSFVPFARRTIVERTVNIGGLTGEYEIEQKVQNELQNESPEELLRVYLEGDVDERASFRLSELEAALERRFFSASVKDRTRQIVDYSAFEKELSLRGEFTRLVLSADGITDEDKREILRCGVAALSGEEVDFR